MDNRALYGFRYYKPRWGNGNAPTILPRFIVDDQSFDVTGGAQNVSLRPGDVVTGLSSGGVNLCDGSETTQEVPFGVVANIRPFFSAGQMTFAPHLPDATSYDTNLTRQTVVGVIPIDAAYWEVDCDEATTATTLAAYQLFVGENVDFINTGASGAAFAFPKLDISSHATTATLMFRIVGISPTVENMDFSGANVKLIVEANVSQRGGAVAAATGTTGI